MEIIMADPYSKLLAMPNVHRPAQLLLDDCCRK